MRFREISPLTALSYAKLPTSTSLKPAPLLNSLSADLAVVASFPIVRLLIQSALPWALQAPKTFVARTDPSKEIPLLLSMLLRSLNLQLSTAIGRLKMELALPLRLPLLPSLLLSLFAF